MVYNKLRVAGNKICHPYVCRVKVSRSLRKGYCSWVLHLFGGCSPANKKAGWRSVRNYDKMFEGLMSFVDHRAVDVFHLYRGELAMPPAAPRRMKT
ncbi:MAG: hypothetical protein VR68_12905 [Peptococcaceae bacterium BRH_c4a]|nr:MAG: hypothetical protein VR68_12905 [Peptococcaceae bacterium BRH_c4a]